MKWPRKNDPDSIRARQELSGVDGLVTSVDLAPFASAAEALTGVAVIPVSLCPLRIELGTYELDDNGKLVETGRAEEDVRVPLAHTEGSLTLSMTRGATAAGTLKTYVLADRITRGSCFVCADAAAAIALAQWVEAQLPAMREWLTSSDDSSLSRHARLREVKTHVVGPMCHVLWAWTTGDAVGPNMMTRNAYALNMGYVMQRAPVKPARAILEANMGGDKKPSYEYFQSGHGKTVIAEAFLADEHLRRVLHTTADDLAALSWAGTHGAVASGMQSVAFTPATAVAAVFAATGQDLGMVGTSSMAHGTARIVPGGLQAAIRFPGLEVGTVGGGTTLPGARDWLTSIGCSGAGKVYRLAQIVAAAALALEISASAAMATAGSENFFKAHHERGRLALIALVFTYDVRDGSEDEFARVYGPEGDWAEFFKGARGYIGTELLRDVELPGRYLLIDRWESSDAYNEFVAAHREDYMRRVDETGYVYERELRFGTFESVW